RSFHSGRFKSRTPELLAQRSQPCTSITHSRSFRGPSEGHVRYAERRRGRRAAQLEVVRDQVDSLEDLVEVRSDRHLADRERQLAAFDPETLSTAREISGHRAEAKAHQLRHVKTARGLLQ